MPAKPVRQFRRSVTQSHSVRALSSDKRDDYAMHTCLGLLLGLLSSTTCRPTVARKLSLSHSSNPATPLHHLHTHPLFLQHLPISPISHLLPSLKSSRFCPTVLTSNLIHILSHLASQGMRISVI